MDYEIKSQSNNQCGICWSNPSLNSGMVETHEQSSHDITVYGGKWTYQVPTSHIDD